MRNCKTISPDRVAKKTMGLEKDFCDTLERKMITHNFQARAVRNYDETHFNVGSTTVRSIVNVDKKQPVHIGEPFQSLCTLLCFISADGFITHSFIILPALFDPETDEVNVTVHPLLRWHDTRSGVNHHYTFSKHGYLTSDLFFIIIKRVVDDWLQTNQNTDLFLFGDQLAAHMQLKTINYASKRNVFMWYFPPHCTHILQPLDSLVFANLKKTIVELSGQAIDDMIFTSPVKKDVFFSVIYKAMDQVFTRKVIKGSFQRTGIFPYSRSTILGNGENNVGSFGCEEKEARNHCISMCTEYIRNKIERENKLISKTKNYNVVVRNMVIYDGEGFLKRDQLKKQRDLAAKTKSVLGKRAREEAKKRETAAKLARKCQGGPLCRRRRSMASSLCETYPTIFFCPDHKALYDQHMKTHEPLAVAPE